MCFSIRWFVFLPVSSSACCLASFSLHIFRIAFNLLSKLYFLSLLWPAYLDILALWFFSGILPLSFLPLIRACDFKSRPSQFNASFPTARPTHFFGKVKKKIPELLVKKQVLYFTSTRSCLINTNCLKLSSILRFCSLFRHLIVLLIGIFYHLITRTRFNENFSAPGCYVSK